MKRLISILICIVLCISMGSVGVSADTASLAEQVLLAVRPRIPDTSGYSDFSSSVSAESGGNTVYHFNWSSNEADEYKGMYVSALENGIITSFGVNDGKGLNGEDGPSGFERISMAEAQNRTKKLVENLNPDIADKLELGLLDTVEQFDAKNHTFSITHTESGIPVYGDRGRVSVDINAQRITSFNMTYTQGLSYPSAEKIAGLTAAKKLFAEEIGLDLCYKVWQDSEKKSVKIFPMYLPKADNVYINATTGKAEQVVPFSDNIYIKNESADMAPAQGGSLGLTPAELKEIENLKKLISKSDTEALVRKIKLLGITDDCTLEEFSTRKLSNIEELYGHSLVFLKKGDERDSYIYVDINAQTGEVLSYSNFGSADGAGVTDEQKAAFCDEILDTLAPSKKDEYRVRLVEGDMGNYIVYDRYVNGIRVDGNTISIELDGNNTLASYRITYTNGDFPQCPDIISNIEASQRLFDMAEYSLVYIPQKSKAELKLPDIAVLVYAIDDYNVFIDPYTGNRINADGTEYKADTSKGEYTDISGHYAEDKIKALRRFGIGFDSDEFLPEDNIRQKDFVTLLAAAFGKNDAVLINDGTKTEDYYRSAEGLGLIKAEEVAPEEVVSRIQAAKFICRGLKIEKYAQMEHIFSCPFNDVFADKGYVTMLWGMGIVSGTSQSAFSPNDSLTRGQAAILIYNAMNNR